MDSKQVSFQYVLPTEEQKEIMQKFRDLYQSLYNEVSMLPGGRGRSIALTKLEESAMWINKALTGND